MTCRVEFVKEDETLGSSLPILSNSNIIVNECKVCNRDTIECSKCSKEFCASYAPGTDVNLPFVYCETCMKYLDTCDPTMHLDLLKLLCVEDEK